MITKRTLNSATIRFNIINYVLETCKHKDFDRIHVTDICRASGISKVTFFKYFDHKEDILMLYKTILNTRICIEVSQRNLSSLKGLEYIIDHFVHLINEIPSIATTLISNLLRKKPPIIPVRLTEADKELFFNDTDFEHVDFLSFWDLVEGFMLEGILNKEITKMTGASELASMFISTLYGAIVASHIRNQEQQAVVFNNITKSWLKCLA